MQKSKKLTLKHLTYNAFIYILSYIITITIYRNTITTQRRTPDDYLIIWQLQLAIDG